MYNIPMFFFFRFYMIDSTNIYLTFIDFEHYIQMNMKVCMEKKQKERQK